MENANIIMTAITTVGFPIVMCGAFFWEIIQMNKQHKAEMDGIRDALNNNTLALQKLTDNLGGGKNENK